MTTKNLFVCNVCGHDYHETCDLINAITLMISDDEVRHISFIEPKGVNSAHDFHICNDCIEGIQKAKYIPRV